MHKNQIVKLMTTLFDQDQSLEVLPEGLIGNELSYSIFHSDLNSWYLLKNGTDSVISIRDLSTSLGSEMADLIVTEKGNEWQIEDNEFQKNINDQEFAEKCWESEADMNDFMDNVFNRINRIIKSKKDKLKTQKEQYIKNVSAIDEATVEIQKLIDAELSDEIKNVDIN